MRMYDFKNKLVEIINQSGLTVEEVYYILKDLFNEISLNYNNILIQEKDNKENVEEAHD